MAKTDYTPKKKKIDTAALEALKPHWEVYEMAVQGSRAWLGENNTFSMEMILPGGVCSVFVPTENMRNFLIENKILVDA